MERYIALLRAVNVGGTARLLMTELKTLCIDAGFQHVRTYIASGNIIFSAREDKAAVKTALEIRLKAHVGKDIGVIIRHPRELKAVLDNNPFSEQDGARTLVLFLDSQPLPEVFDLCKGRKDEVIVLGDREIYVYFPDGMGRSKLKIPGAEKGTARNMNTVEKLVVMAHEGGCA